MFEIDLTNPDFDVLLFEDEEAQPIAPKLEPVSPEVLIKHENDEGSESDGEEIMPDLGMRSVPRYAP